MGEEFGINFITTKVKDDDSCSLQYTKKSNYEIPITNTASYGLEFIKS